MLTNFYHLFTSISAVYDQFMMTFGNVSGNASVLKLFRPFVCF